MSKLSRYEKVILALGLAFLLAAGGYRLGGESRARPAGDGSRSRE